MVFEIYDTPSGSEDNLALKLITFCKFLHQLLNANIEPAY